MILGSRSNSDRIIYDYAMSFVGKPYIWGGDDPIDGFDCSGLVIEIMRAWGLFPAKGDMTAKDLMAYYTRDNRGAYASTPNFGALAFFGRDVTNITHVGFCLDSFCMIEAGGGGSKTKSKEDAALQNAYVRVRPLRYRTDMQTVVMPNISSKL